MVEQREARKVELRAELDALQHALRESDAKATQAAESVGNDVRESTNALREEYKSALKEFTINVEQNQNSQKVILKKKN